jgi:hypothetical protein
MCYFHMKATLCKGLKADVERVVGADITTMHYCTRKEVWKQMCYLFRRKWVAMGLTYVADHLRDGYLCAPWDTWYIGGLPMSGK